jgi:hypothetical protein
MVFTGLTWTKILGSKACCWARSQVKAKPHLSDGFSEGKLLNPRSRPTNRSRRLVTTAFFKIGLLAKSPVRVIDFADS